ncbi:MAG TPA: diaminopimelate epimerase [Candidatus Adamsella sp.]|nr:diaminopimelate epimerase [Candidatus Adamsella sp.]
MKFTKMQGLGNDFVLVDYEEIKNSDIPLSELAARMCDRKFGIGADGLIVVNPDDMKSNTDVCWRILNSDGSEPQMCGNGMRCFAQYVFNHGLVKEKKFSVNTLAGTIIPEVLDNDLVRVNMGKPILEAEKIPVQSNLFPVLNDTLQAEDRTFQFSAVSMGNPHCLIFTDENTEELALKYGSSIENNPIFPEKTNVEFIKVISEKHIKINVWERGCGITLACGTGACASTVAAILNNLTENKVKADLPGGTLTIEWAGNSIDKDNDVFMTGSAKVVFEGEYLL